MSETKKSVAEYMNAAFRRLDTEKKENEPQNTEVGEMTQETPVQPETNQESVESTKVTPTP